MNTTVVKPAGHQHKWTADGAPTRTIAVLGATGFCGAHIVDQCLRRGFAVRALSRTPASRHAPHLRSLAVDVGDRSALTAALTGVDGIVHAASYTGSDPVLAWSTNRDGTASLTAVAHDLGIDSLLYLSTIGVYGPGPFRDRPETAPVAPVTELSRSRVAAEDLVIDAGGLVLRPGFIHGPGPKSFLTGLARITAALDALVDDGAALQSTVSVTALAALVAGLLTEPFPARLRTSVLNVADDKPRPIRELVSDAEAAGLLTVPTRTLTLAEAQRTAGPAGLTERQVDLVAVDHTLDVGRLRSLQP
ncbi:NAD-dependent epimerase/dehydratase family protein [Gordonia sp. FQ]|uniref:NAD-dependent epimerase/dehydratase family protein n=1 Tax=Gordonia sp. FQ TaxID=3446634 RepID=UPI003F860043